MEMSEITKSLITLNSEFYIKKGILYYKIYHISLMERKPKKIYQSKSYAEAKEVLRNFEDQKNFLIKEMKRRTGSPSPQN